MSGRRWLAAGAFAALGCSSPPSEAPAETTAGIVEGEPSGEAQDSVVMLRAVPDEGELLCSGTLVAPNLVVTARHCVSHLTLGLFSCSVRGELIEAEEGAGRLGAHLPADSIEVFGRETPRKTSLARGKQVLSTLSTTVCTNDLAFLVLDRDLELPVSPLRAAGPALRQEPAVLVGFGMDGAQRSLDYQTAPRLQKRGISIVDVGPDAVEDVTSVPPRTVIIEGISGCTGDSGGPLLAGATGAVLGVYSLMNGAACTDPSVKHQMVHVPAFSGLIAQAFDAAGHEPVLEQDPQLTPAGGAGGAGASGEASDAGHASSDESGGAGGARDVEPTQPSDGSREPPSSCALAKPSRADASALLLSLLAALAATRRRRRAS